MKKLENAQIIEKSSLYLDLSDSLLNKIDKHFLDTQITEQHKQELIELMEEIYGESYVNSMTD